MKSKRTMMAAILQEKMTILARLILTDGYQSTQLYIKSGGWSSRALVGHSHSSFLNGRELRPAIVSWVKGGLRFFNRTARATC